VVALKGWPQQHSLLNARKIIAFQICQRPVIGGWQEIATGRQPPSFNLFNERDAIDFVQRRLPFENQP
jgi:hypothetical protein